MIFLAEIVCFQQNAPNGWGQSFSEISEIQKALKYPEGGGVEA